MLGFIENFDDALFVCTESEIASIEELGIDLKLHETNKPGDGFHWFYEPAFFFRLQAEEDRNLLKVTHKCINMKLGDLYGFGSLPRESFPRKKA